jgi:hypothetical protein
MFLAIGHQVLPSGRMVLPVQSSIVLLSEPAPARDTLLPLISCLDLVLNFGLSLVPAILLIPMQIITNRSVLHSSCPFYPS